MGISQLLSAAPAISTAVPTGILLAIIGWLWRMLVTSERRHRTYIDGINKDYEADVRDLREQISQLRTEITNLRVELREERDARMKAEEDAHRARIEKL